MKRHLALFALVLLSQWSSPLLAAEEPTAARQSFDTVFQQWKDNLAGLRLLQAKAEQAEDSELPELSKEFAGLLKKGDALIPKLRDAAIAVYREAPNEDRQITDWLSTLVSDFVSSDQFEAAASTITALIEGKADDPVLFNQAGIVAFVRHDFAKAKEYLQRAAGAGVLTEQSQAMLYAADDYLEYWKTEKELREKADALEGDARLPRVRIETNKGTMVVELFEDEAPETVGNFVSLVSSGFYNGLTFHRVLGGFMAQGGCPDGNGTGGPGYEIYCECVKENHRKHFTGSLSMAHSGNRDTGGSQFFITFAPTDHLNGRHTVFGRVIEGLDVLAKLQRRDSDKSSDLAIEPDKIIKAEVIHKRDHRYVPRKVR